MSNLEKGLETMQALVGTETNLTDWFEIDQERINQFADVTLDHQWIHLDPERAKDGPFGTTIAHGLFTLSIMMFLPGEGGGLPKLEGSSLGINYGYDRIRFPSPVPIGSKIRTRSILKRAEIKGPMLEVMTEHTVEVQGSDKPACVAENVLRLVF